MYFSLLSTRRQIRVDKVLVHENFNDSANDIALLRLGKDCLSGDPLKLIQLTTNSQKREWISQSSAQCAFLTLVKALLTRMGTSMVSSISPRKRFTLFYFFLSISGWGDTGVQETSTDKLQETVVPIVQSSNCINRMNQTEGVNEDLIVCAGGAGSGGPCKVNHKLFIN